MKVIVAPSLALLFAVAGTLAAADLKSGLEVGQKAGPFNVKDITGENKGKSLCYR